MVSVSVMTAEAARNPDAIAWYVEQAQRLLEDQQRRAESLRTRGGQVAGFGATVLALIGANAEKILRATDGTGRTLTELCLLASAGLLALAVAVAVIGAVRPRSFAAISADEIENYLTDQFLSEPDLWRVHVRTLRALAEATETAQDAGNGAAKALNRALAAFLVGLLAALIAIGTLIIQVN